MSWWKWLNEAVFPVRCIICKREGAWLCDMHNHFCDAPKNEAHFQYIDPVYAITAYYDPVVKKFIEYFKFRGFSALADIIGKQIDTNVPKEVLNNAVLVPIPLHWKRKLWRGFNQAEKIAQAMQRNNPSLQIMDNLYRIRKTKQQATLKKDERLKNIANVFEWRGETIPTKIILIDDVVASGGTLDSAAMTLKSGGAQNVSGIVFARGGKPCQNSTNET